LPHKAADTTWNCLRGLGLKADELVLVVLKQAAEVTARIVDSARPGLLLPLSEPAARAAEVGRRFARPKKCGEFRREGLTSVGLIRLSGHEDVDGRWPELA
jgi:hypothetical protein